MFRRLCCIIFYISLASGCASYAPPGGTGCSSFLECVEPPETLSPSKKKLLDLPSPIQKAVVAVYAFSDLTGQRQSSQNMALFSTAVTQGADHYLINTLRSVGNGSWFVVVERSALDALTRERQLIRQTRQTYDGEKGNTLKPLLFAGLIFEGAIVEYDVNVGTGGSGARYLGIGATNQWRKDRITVSLRIVLVQTGEVLLSTLVSKSVLSSGTSRDFFRFVELGTELVELETGFSQNEAVGHATRAAIEESVYQIIQKGLDKQFWDFDYSESK